MRVAGLRLHEYHKNIHQLELAASDFCSDWRKRVPGNLHAASVSCINMPGTSAGERLERQLVECREAALETQS